VRKPSISFVSFKDSIAEQESEKPLLKPSPERRREKDISEKSSDRPRFKKTHRESVSMEISAFKKALEELNLTGKRDVQSEPNMDCLTEEVKVESENNEHRDSSEGSGLLSPPEATKEKLPPAKKRNSKNKKALSPRDNRPKATEQQKQPDSAISPREQHHEILKKTFSKLKLEHLFYDPSKTTGEVSDSNSPRANEKKPVKRSKSRPALNGISPALNEQRRSSEEKDKRTSVLIPPPRDAPPPPVDVSSC